MTVCTQGTIHSTNFDLCWLPSLCDDPTGKQKNQEQPIEEVLEELRAKLKWTQGELEAQREAERQRQVQVGVERSCQGAQSWTGQETHDALTSCRAKILAASQEPGVRARMASSWMCQMILDNLERKTQLLGQTCMVKREPSFLH